MPTTSTLWLPGVASQAGRRCNIAHHQACPPVPVPPGTSVTAARSASCNAPEHLGCDPELHLALQDVAVQLDVLQLRSDQRHAPACMHAWRNNIAACTFMHGSMKCMHRPWRTHSPPPAFGYLRTRSFSSVSAQNVLRCSVASLRNCSLADGSTRLSSCRTSAADMRLGRRGRCELLCCELDRDNCVAGTMPPVWRPSYLILASTASLFPLCMSLHGHWSE